MNFCFMSSMHLPTLRAVFFFTCLTYGCPLKNLPFEGTTKHPWCFETERMFCLMSRIKGKQMNKIDNSLQLGWLPKCINPTTLLLSTRSTHIINSGKKKSRCHPIAMGQNLITNGRNERDFKLNFCFSRNFNPRSFFRRSSYLIVINIKCIFSTTVLISYQIKMKLLPVIYLTAEILFYLVLSTSLLTTHNGGVTGEINIGRKKISKIVTKYLF